MILIYYDLVNYERRIVFDSVYIIVRRFRRKAVYRMKIVN
jgi:hypothetical protein